MSRPKKSPDEIKFHKLKLVTFGDIVTPVDPVWHVLLSRFHKFARIYGFAKVEVPLLEDLALYKNFPRDFNSRLVKTDIFGRAMAVRPALLPSVLRAYHQHKVFEIQPISKWMYFGQTLELGKEHEVKDEYAFGFEVFGSFNHLTEAQVIAAVWQLLSGLGLDDLTLEITNIGKSDCQTAYQETLKDYLRAKKYDLCDECNEHLLGRSLNIFRCANLDCQATFSEAPTILDFLDQEAHKHFTNILEALDELRIPYQLNPLYAGADGSSRTNLAIRCKSGGSFVLIGEGAYHEDLMQKIAGKDWCCFGFAGSLSAVYESLSKQQVEVEKAQKNEVFLVPLGELAAKRSLRLFRDLIDASISVYDHFGNAGIKSQLKQAESNHSPIALIMGQKEAVDETVILRDVKSGMQEIFSYDKIVEEVKKRLGK